MAQAPAYWERRLKEAGLSARRDEEWRHYPRVSLQAMKFHGRSVAHHDRYSWERVGDPFEQLKAAAPPEIRRIAELDHRRRTRKEQEKLNHWIENVGGKAGGQARIAKGVRLTQIIHWRSTSNLDCWINITKLDCDSTKGDRPCFANTSYAE